MKLEPRLGSNLISQNLIQVLTNEAKSRQKTSQSAWQIE